LPKQQIGVKQPDWVYKRRQFLKSLSVADKNFILTGDPAFSFDPVPYTTVYNFSYADAVRGPTHRVLPPVQAPAPQVQAPQVPTPAPAQTPAPQVQAPAPQVQAPQVPTPAPTQTPAPQVQAPPVQAPAPQVQAPQMTTPAPAQTPAPQVQRAASSITSQKSSTRASKETSRSIQRPTGKFFKFRFVSLQHTSRVARFNNKLKDKR
jgi:hypothetical protein